MEDKKQATRIQTSILNAAEKKVLVWLANHLPKWISSDMMTWIGVAGAVMCGCGFVLTHYNLQWLWLSIAGLFINWFGDSLDGTIARVRQQQRPLYGYYLDHNIDVICEFFIFAGIGLSPLAHMGVALLCYSAYLALTVYVSINAHLKSEFKLTYGKMGPTEFRLLLVIMCLMFMYIPVFTTFNDNITFFEQTIEYTLFDIIGCAIWVILTIMYLGSFIKDARWFAERDPLKKSDKQ